MTKAQNLSANDEPPDGNDPSEPKPLLRAVYLDTNALRSVGHTLHKPWLDKLVEAAREHRFALCVPRLVVDEWCFQLAEQFTSRVRSAIASIDFARDLLLDDDHHIDAAVLLPLVDRISDLQKERLMACGIEIIANTLPTTEELVQQAVTTPAMNI